MSRINARQGEDGKALYEIARECAKQGSDGQPLFQARMLQRGLTLDARDVEADKCNLTALHWACTKRDLAAMQLLIDAGVDVNATAKEDDAMDENYDPYPTHHGDTALGFAAAKGFTELIKPLLDARVDPDISYTSSSGVHYNTPLQAALARGHFDAAELIMCAGANPNIGTIYQPALWLAIGGAPDAMTYELACRGANVDSIAPAISTDPIPHGSSLANVALALTVGCPEALITHVRIRITTSAKAAAEFERLKKFYAGEFARYKEAFEATHG